MFIIFVFHSDILYEKQALKKTIVFLPQFIFCLDQIEYVTWPVIKIA